MIKMIELSDNQKISLLKYNNWFCVQGFSFDFEKPEDVNNVVVSFDEVMNKLKSGVEWFCMTEFGDYFVDLDTAWDDFLDEISCELDTDNILVIEQHIESMLKNCVGDRVE